MRSDAGYVLVALIALAVAAALAPAASTQEAGDCIENSVACHAAEGGTEAAKAAARGARQDGPNQRDPGLRDPYPSAPRCPTHDPRSYHGLWDEERGCHYDHQHGDNPHLVDHIFGRAYYEWAGGEISYPWQTPGENEEAHGAYGWFVRRDLPCDAPYADGCITDFRAQYHGFGAAQAAVSGYHSAWLEARVCLEQQPERCGIVRVGGWQGPADLAVDDERILDREDSGNRILRHYHDSQDPAAGVWYTSASSGLFSIVPRFEDMWNTVPPLSSPEAIVAQSHWFCAGEQGQPAFEGCTHNSSRAGPHAIGFQLPAQILEQLDVDPEGFAHYRGYVNRLGYIDAGCRAPGPACIPFVVENVASHVAYEYRGHAREYDICFAGDGSVTSCDRGRPSGWLVFPMH